MGARPIVCEKTDTDSYGRTVAVCRSGSVDLAAEMVSAGLALAYRQYGDEYVDEEAAARSARRGLWKDDFTPPWDWRKNPPAERPSAQRAENPAPRNENRGSCLIKGNINYEGERIYHVPGSPSYESTKIDPSKDERWFCSEDEARSNGWRAPRG